jgi:hypothetical protein
LLNSCFNCCWLNDGKNLRALRNAFDPVEVCEEVDDVVVEGAVVGDVCDSGMRTQRKVAKDRKERLRAQAKHFFVLKLLCRNDNNNIG